MCTSCGEVTPREPFQHRLAALNPEAAAAVARASVGSDAAARLVDPGEDGGLQARPQPEVCSYAQKDWGFSKMVSQSNLPLVRRKNDHCLAGKRVFTGVYRKVIAVHSAEP